MKLAIVCICSCFFMGTATRLTASESTNLFGAYLMGAASAYAVNRGNWLAAGIGLAAAGSMLENRETSIRQRHRYSNYDYQPAPNDGYDSYRQDTGCGNNGGYYTNCGSYGGYGSTCGGGRYRSTYSGTENSRATPTMISITENVTYTFDQQRDTITEVRTISRAVEYAPVSGSKRYVTRY